MWDSLWRDHRRDDCDVERHLEDKLREQDERCVVRERFAMQTADESQSGNIDSQPESDHAQGTDQPQLFADHGENKIGIGFGKKAQFLKSFPKPPPPQSTPPPPDRPLLDLLPPLHPLSPCFPH